jgi:DNA-binding MarR family transcriptional regulator
MKRLWLMTKRAVLEQLTQTAHNTFVELADKLAKVQLEIQEHFHPERTEQLRKEFERMMNSLEINPSPALVRPANKTWN